MSWGKIKNETKETTTTTKREQEIKRDLEINSHLHILMNILSQSGVEVTDLIL